MWTKNARLEPMTKFVEHATHSVQDIRDQICWTVCLFSLTDCFGD